jgi:tRNA A-37 threonylcarbamoyl transferase component Bud32
VHCTGYVYGDLKADNICLSRQKKHCLKLIDFGLAQPFITEEALKRTTPWKEEDHIEQT